MAAVVATLGQRIQFVGGPPASAQATGLQMLRSRLRIGGHWLAALLLVPVVFMATARYLDF